MNYDAEARIRCFWNQINEKYVAEAKMVKLELELGYTNRTSVRFIVVIEIVDCWLNV